MGQVLVVDDELHVLRAFVEMLAGQGYEVRAVERGEEALDLLRLEQPEVVIMDVGMPGMSGLDALRRMREGHPRLPVILMTGQANPHFADEAARLGAFDYQRKPFEPQVMLAAIERACQSRAKSPT